MLALPLASTNAQAIRRIEWVLREYLAVFEGAINLQTFGVRGSKIAIHRSQGRHRNRARPPASQPGVSSLFTHSLSFSAPSTFS
jgi:hypothetical protein